MSKSLRSVVSRTFQLAVLLPTPGGGPCEITFTFRHRTVSEIKELLSEIATKSDLEIAQLLVVGWDLEDEFNEENLQLLVDNFHGCASTLAAAYTDEYVKGYRKGLH